VSKARLNILVELAEDLGREMVEDHEEYQHLREDDRIARALEVIALELQIARINSWESET